MSDKKLFFNGIDADTGGYLLPPMAPEQLAKVAAGDALDPEDLRALKFRSQSSLDYGVIEGVDPKDLSQAGWGVVFPFARKGSEEHARQEGIREALAPLLELRRAQASARKGHLYKEYLGPDAYRPGERKQSYLARLGAGPGPADPEKVPYYLLLVGDPTEIPFDVQSQIDVQYAVGRIHFDTLEAYHTYAQSVVAAETGGLKRARKAAFWGVDCPDDPATNLSAEHMVAPLSRWAQGDQAARGWSLSTWLKGDATKANLARLLGGEDTPALLYTASHGMGMKRGHPLQRRHQGALLCQDWPGPQAWGRKPITPDLYFSADDLKDAGSLLGLIGFFFACYGGGTPLFDEFSKQAFKSREEIAPFPFVADLPRQMLSHPKGGALAVIAHVERAWGTSFVWEGTDRNPGASKAQLAVFESTLKRLMEGHPVGSAMEYFNQRYAELSSDLSHQMEMREYDDPNAADELELASMWTANNDARGYAIIGDPAVRLPVAQEGQEPVERGAIELSSRANPTPASPSPQAAEVPSTPAISSAADDAAASPGGPESATPVSFGLFGGSKDDNKAPSTPSELRTFLTDVMGAFGQSVRDATELEVRTYTSRDVESAAEGRVNVDDVAQLRAYTLISLDGDIDACVPMTDEGEVDEALWSVHLSMVEQAQANRKELLNTAMDMIARMVESMKLS